MDRAAKRELVTTLNGVFNETTVIVVAHYSGLTVAQMQVLRRQMRAAGASLKVAKNRLVRIALDGTAVAQVGALLKGPTVLAYSADPVAAAKVAVDFSKTHDKFVILGGSLGENALNVDGVKALAALPSLDELRGRLIGIINAPATKIATISSAPAAQLARLLKAHAEKSEEAA